MPWVCYPMTFNCTPPKLYGKTINTIGNAENANFQLSGHTLKTNFIVLADHLGAEDFLLGRNFLGTCNVVVDLTAMSVTIREPKTPRHFKPVREVSDHITVHRQAFCCFSWNPGHENWEKSWNPGQNFSLMLSVSWIPRQCLSWIPRQYCCYNGTFAAALWLVRWFWVIIFGKVEKFKLIHIYIKGNCFDWHEKSQSTNRDTRDWYQNWSMSLKSGRFWWSGSFFSKLVLNWKIRIFVL